MEKRCRIISIDPTAVEAVFILPAGVACFGIPCPCPFPDPGPAGQTICKMETVCCKTRAIRFIPLGSTGGIPIMSDSFRAASRLQNGTEGRCCSAFLWLASRLWIVKETGIGGVKQGAHLCCPLYMAMPHNRRIISPIWNGWWKIKINHLVRLFGFGGMVNAQSGQ